MSLLNLVLTMKSFGGVKLIQLPIVDHYILGPFACTIGYNFFGAMFSNM